MYKVQYRGQDACIQYSIEVGVHAEVRVPVYNIERSVCMYRGRSVCIEVRVYV